MDSNANVSVDILENYYKEHGEEIDNLGKEVDNLCGSAEEINNVLYKVDNLLDNDNVTSQEIAIVYESYLNIAKQTPIYDCVDMAYNISLESAVDNGGGVLYRVKENIKLFLKRLYQYIKNIVNKIIRIFKNSRFKITTIIGRIIERGNRLPDLMLKLQNQDRIFFHKDFDFYKIKDAVNEYCNKTPGYYIEVTNENALLDISTTIANFNIETTQLIEGLKKTLLSATAQVKGGHVDEHVDLGETLIENTLVKKHTKDFHVSVKYMDTLKDYLRKNKLVDPKAKAVIPMFFNKHGIAYLYFMPFDKDENEFVYTKEIAINEISTINLPGKISLGSLNKAITFTTNEISGKLLTNRDSVYELTNIYDDFIELCEAMLNTQSDRMDLEKLKDLTIFVNKNVYPIIYRLLVKQYVALVLLYNNRLGLFETMIKAIMELKDK